MSMSFKDKLNIFNKPNESTQQNKPNQPKPQKLQNKLITQNGQKQPIQQNQPIQPKNINVNAPTTNNQVKDFQENGHTQQNINLNKFPKDINDYIRKANQIKHPVKGSKLLGKEENLKIYKYEQPKTKEGKIVTLIFVGETGSGKSTLINGLLNYFLGILKTYDFRYKIVVGENEADQTKSQTQEINTYLISSPLYPGITFQFIDTPGFADTENKKDGDKTKDEKIYTLFVEFFKKKFFAQKELLNAACFIIKASANRFNQYQRQILSEVTSLFASDIKDNFLIMYTFSDTCKPKSIQFLNEVDTFKERAEKEKKEKDKTKKNKLKWYWCVTTNKYFEDLSEAPNSYQLSYDENIMEFILFVNKVISLEALDAALTKKNLELNEELKVTKNIIKTQILNNLLKKYNAINETQNQLKSAIEELNKKQDELDKIESTLNEKKNKVNTLSNEITQNNIEILRLNTKINEYKSSETRLKNELDGINNQINELNTNKNKAIEDKNKLETNKTNTEKEMRDLQEKIEKSKLENNVNNIQDLEKELEKKKNQLTIINNDIEKYNQEKDNLDRKLNDYKEKQESLNKEVTNIKNKKAEIESQHLSKENEQNNLRKILDTYNTKNNKEQLENIIKKLKESKLEKKEIIETKYDKNQKESKKKNLICEKCKVNCHPDCNCNWLFFWKGKNSWWCNEITKEGYCKICSHNYEEHLRDFYVYEPIEKKEKKIVGLNESEIREIDEKIDLLETQIKQIEKSSELSNVQDSIKEIDNYKKSIKNKVTSMDSISAEVDKLTTSINYINKQATIKKTENDLIKKSLEINGIEKQLTSKTNLKENKEGQIQIIKSNKEVDNKNLLKKELLKQQKENELGTLNSEIGVKTSERNNLFDEIRDVYQKKKNKILNKNTDLNTQKEIIEKNAIYQLLRIQIIIDEIAKIQINKKNKISIDNEINDIISSNEDFIRKRKEITTSIIDKFKKVYQEMKTNESKILVEYGIDKENLLSSSKKN